MKWAIELNTLLINFVCRCRRCMHNRHHRRRRRRRQCCRSANRGVCVYHNRALARYSRTHRQNLFAKTKPKLKKKQQPGRTQAKEKGTGGVQRAAAIWSGYERDRGGKSLFRKIINGYNILYREWMLSHGTHAREYTKIWMQTTILSISGQCYS